MRSTIRTAYSYSPRFKSYQARACVVESECAGLPGNHSFRHTITTGIGDTAAEAITDAVKACNALLTRDAGKPVDNIEHAGRVSVDILTAAIF